MPLRSALASRLLIQRLKSPIIPATLSDQATWWSTYYNPSQSASHFLTLVSTFENTPGMHLAFVGSRQDINKFKTNSIVTWAPLVKSHKTCFLVH